MKLISFCLLFFLGVSLSAQEWAPLGAIWHYSEDWDDPPGTRYSKWEVTKDTLILDQLCREIKISSHTANGVSSLIDYRYTFMRNDSAFYYRPDPNAFFLEYDFSMNLGDTIRIPLYEVNSPNEISFAELIVDSINIIESNGIQLRDFFVHPLGNNWGWYHRFTERIGSPTGIHVGYFTVALLPPIFRCYADQEVMLNFTSQDCEYLMTTRTEEESLNQLINIYPNPGVDHWKVEVPMQLNGLRYEIRSSLDQIMKEGVLENDFIIENNQFPVGLYFLVIHQNQQQILVRLLKI